MTDLKPLTSAELLPSTMKMADVKVGMRLVSTVSGGPAFSPITVTEITARGFRYKLDAPVCLHPLMGTTEGGEHFGHDGECFYTPENTRQQPAPPEYDTKEVMPNTGQLRPHNAMPPATPLAPGANAPPAGEPDWIAAASGARPKVEDAEVAEAIAQINGFLNGVLKAEDVAVLVEPWVALSSRRGEGVEDRAPPSNAGETL